MRTPHRFLTLAVMICSSLLAKANNEENENKKAKVNEGVVQGTVINASTKKPVCGVVISITSLKAGEKEIVSDGSGNFKASQLPLGEVTVQVEKKGYKVWKKDGFMLKDGTALKLSIELLPYLDEEEEENSSNTWHPLFRIISGK